MKNIHGKLIVFSLMTICAQAASIGTLRGIVHDPQHRPLPGAQVVVRGSPPKSVVTDMNGEFQVDMPEGS